MKLEFLFIPTSDLSASLALYRDGLGFTELWREGDTTTALALAGSDVQIMLDANDPDAPMGPMFVVESLAAFHAARPDTLAVLDEPAAIPGGFLATYRDPGGATIYVRTRLVAVAPLLPFCCPDRGHPADHGQGPG